MLSLFFLLFCSVQDVFSAESQLRDSSFVKVRIWPADLNEFSVGHVSLEFLGGYLSLWPGDSQQVSEEQKCCVQINKAQMRKNYRDDLDHYSPKKPHVFLLYLGDKIQEIRSMYKKYTSMRGTREEEKLYALPETVHWYSLGKPVAVTGIEIQVGHEYFHCATFVIQALMKADQTFKTDLSHKMQEKRSLSTSELFSLWGVDKGSSSEINENRELSKLLQTFSPNDFLSILQARMQKDLSRILSGLFLRRFSDAEKSEKMVDFVRKYLTAANETQKSFFGRIGAVKQDDHLYLEVHDAEILKKIAELEQCFNIPEEYIYTFCFFATIPIAVYFLKMYLNRNLQRNSVIK